MRLGDYLVFLRRLISNSSMGKYLCKPQWIKLLMSFLSLKPCDDLELFLKFNKEELFECDSPKPSSSKDLSSPVENNCQTTDRRDLTEIEKNICRNILLTPGLRPRLLTIQLLESVLELIPPESSDLREQVRTLILFFTNFRCILNFCV